VEEILEREGGSQGIGIRIIMNQDQDLSFPPDDLLQLFQERLILIVGIHRRPPFEGSLYHILVSTPREHSKRVPKNTLFIRLFKNVQMQGPRSPEE